MSVSNSFRTHHNFPRALEHTIRINQRDSIILVAWRKKRVHATNDQHPTNSGESMYRMPPADSTEMVTLHLCSVEGSILEMRTLSPRISSRPIQAWQTEPNTVRLGMTRV